MNTSKRKRSKKDTGKTARVRKSRTPKRSVPDDVSDYVLAMCGGNVPDDISDLEKFTGIPADLSQVDEAKNETFRTLNDTVDYVNQSRRDRMIDPVTELQGSLYTEEKYETFARSFEALRERHGYSDEPVETGTDPNPLFYTIWEASKIPELEDPSLSTVDPCLLLDDAKRFAIMTSGVYQDFEALLAPFISAGAPEFVLTTDRKRILDQSGWMECYGGIEPDQRFACEFLISRVGNWGVYILLEKEGTSEGQRVVYYMYVTRTQT